jgi:hypothetical protein
MGIKQTFKPEQIEAALRATAGIRSAAAAKLGCSPNTVTNYIRRYKSLQVAEAEILDINIDIAEGKLLTAIKRGDIRAVRFYLETKGAHRGYTKRTEVSGPNGSPVQTSTVAVYLPRERDE